MSFASLTKTKQKFDKKKVLEAINLTKDHMLSRYKNAVPGLEEVKIVITNTYPEGTIGAYNTREHKILLADPSLVYYGFVEPYINYYRKMGLKDITGIMTKIMSGLLMHEYAHGIFFPKEANGEVLGLMSLVKRLGGYYVKQVEEMGKALNILGNIVSDVINEIILLAYEPYFWLYVKAKNASEAISLLLANKQFLNALAKALKNTPVESLVKHIANNDTEVLKLVLTHTTPETQFILLHKFTVSIAPVLKSDSKIEELLDISKNLVENTGTFANLEGTYLVYKEFAESIKMVGDPFKLVVNYKPYEFIIENADNIVEETERFIDIILGRSKNIRPTSNPTEIQIRYYALILAYYILQVELSRAVRLCNCNKITPPIPSLLLFPPKNMPSQNTSSTQKPDSNEMKKVPKAQCSSGKCSRVAKKASQYGKRMKKQLEKQGEKKQASSCNKCKRGGSGGKKEEKKEEKGGKDEKKGSEGQKECKSCKRKTGEQGTSSNSSDGKKESESKEESKSKTEPNNQEQNALKPFVKEKYRKTPLVGKGGGGGGSVIDELTFDEYEILKTAEKLNLPVLKLRGKKYREKRKVGETYVEFYRNPRGYISPKSIVAAEMLKKSGIPPAAVWKTKYRGMIGFEPEIDRMVMPPEKITAVIDVSGSTAALFMGLNKYTIKSISTFTAEKIIITSILLPIIKNRWRTKFNLIAFSDNIVDDIEVSNPDDILRTAVKYVPKGMNGTDLVGAVKYAIRKHRDNYKNVFIVVTDAEVWENEALETAKLIQRHIKKSPVLFVILNDSVGLGSINILKTYITGRLKYVIASNEQRWDKKLRKAIEEISKRILRRLS